MVGPHQRLEGDLIHLWHQPQAGRCLIDYSRNRTILDRLRRAAEHSREALLNLLQEIEPRAGTVPQPLTEEEKAWRLEENARLVTSRKTRAGALRQEVKTDTRPVTFRLKARP